MVREVKIQWHESIEEFRTLWQSEPSPERRERLHALLLLRSGFNSAEVAEIAQFDRHELRYLVSRYQRKGVWHALGYMVHRDTSLSVEQQRALVRYADRHRFETLDEAIQWIEYKWGVRYTAASIRSLFAKLNIQTRHQQLKKGGSAKELRVNSYAEA